MNIGFIGAGKVGCTLGKHFSKAPQVKLVGYYSRSSDSAREAAHFTGSKSYENMKELIEACDTIFITVPDGSIRDTWNEVRGYDIRGKTICHCSGSMSSREAFEGIRQTGAFGYSAHPLFAVSDKYEAYRELTGVFFTLEGGPEQAAISAAAGDVGESAISAPAADAGEGGKDKDAKGTTAEGQRLQAGKLAELQELLESLGNPTRIIPGRDKVKYHCAAAMASNLVCGLVQQSLDLMTECGFAEEEALQALSPILRGNMEHIAAKGPADSLTGPVERNDAGTVRKHLDCLTDPETREIYRLLSCSLAELAKRRHPERDHNELTALLSK